MFANYLFGLLQFIIFGKELKKMIIQDWLLFGLFAALGVLSKYLFIYLLVYRYIFYLFDNKKKI